MEDYESLHITAEHSLTRRTRGNKDPDEIDSNLPLAQKIPISETGSSLRIDPDLIKKLMLGGNSIIKKDEAYFPRDPEKLKEMRK